MHLQLGPVDGWDGWAGGADGGMVGWLLDCVVGVMGCSWVIGVRMGLVWVVG